MSHKTAKRVRQELRGLLGRKDIDTSRTYIQSWCSPRTALNLPGSDRAILQTAKRNVKRMRRGIQPVSPRKTGSK